MARKRDDRGSKALEHSVLPLVDRVVEQRSVHAAEQVSRLRAEFPDDTPEELANRLIRRCAREMSIAGAVSGGAAAAPVAGMAVAAASAGVDSAYSMNRLGELIMGIGEIYGHGIDSHDERRAAVLAVIGLVDGAAVGMSGLAAKAGARGGARVLSKVPSPAAGAVSGGVARRTVSKLGAKSGPWSLAALVPYGIGAGVGAAGNGLLARAVGKAAKQYFASSDPSTDRREVLLEDAGDGEVLDDDMYDDSSTTSGHGYADSGVDDDIVDAEIVD